MWTGIIILYIIIMFFVTLSEYKTGTPVPKFLLNWVIQLFEYPFFIVVGFAIYLKQWVTKKVKF